MNVTFTMRFAFMITLHVVVVMLSHPETQVTLAEVPVGRGGPSSTPKLTIRLGPVGPVPLKHATVAVLHPVTMLPEL
jgi:hypothetical protein